MITKNEVYTKIANAVDALNLGCYCSSVYEPVPPQFPCVFCYEYDSVPNTEAITLTFDDVQANSTFNAEVYVLKTDGMAKANKIADAVEAAFKSAYYIKTMRQQIDNADNSIYRITLRFHRKIGGSDTI